MSYYSPYGQQSNQNSDNFGQAVRLGGDVIKTLNPTQSFLHTPPIFGGAGQTIGKLLPFAGLATGTLGLIRGGNPLSNIGSGFTAGASLGSIVPGLGTLVGGGIGALVGGVRSLFHGPSQQELQGRQVNDNLTNLMISRATDQQRQEAAQAASGGVWKGNQNGALSLIELRDKLISQGFSPDVAIAQSNAIMGGLNPATRGGAQSVINAARPIQAIMGFE